MPRRSQTFTKFPWNGGLNSSINSGVLNDNDLVTADNIIFTTVGTRKKREGFSYFDTDPPGVIVKSSSTTTRILRLASDINGTDDIFVVGERITITGDSNYNITNTPITAVTSNTISYTHGASLAEGSTSTSAITITKVSSYINLTDYWYFSAAQEKTQLLLAGTDYFKLYKFDANGNRTNIEADSGATEPAAQLTKLNSIVMNNKAVFAFPVIGDLPIKYNPDDDAKYQLLGGSPPDFSIMTEHLGRMWTNDKTNPDRLHYSSTGDIEEWLGNGDSGALDISPGDGDPVGITGLYTFKGILFIAKGTKLYRVSGYSPEEFLVEPVSKGLGIESHQSIIPVDQDDVVFLSKRGFHSTIATTEFGDTASKYLSLNIQNDFNDFTSTRLQYVQGTYIPELNSIVFSIAEEGESSQNNLWLYNVIVNQWYRWPEISCSALSRRLENGKFKMVIGMAQSRVAQAMNGEYSDFGSEGIFYRIKTGTIYPGGNPESIKGFKRLGFLFEPTGRFVFTVRVKIDNYPIQSLSFSAESGVDTLGETFVLGESILGATNIVSPQTKLIDGHGRGLTIEVSQSGTDEQVELLGYLIEFVEEDIKREVI